MGPMGSGTEQGFLLHSALALTAEGVPLGWVGQIAWARDWRQATACRVTISLAGGDGLADGDHAL